MTQPARFTRASLWFCLLVYSFARVSQLFADHVPTLLYVVLHVVPPAVFAIVHGAETLGRRGILLFAACCLGVGSSAELLSLNTGFPFGYYHFTDVMGPKILGLPILLSLAYLGIGYASWRVAMSVLGPNTRPLSAALLAAFTMTSWDLSMDPYWATVHHVWIWHDGGLFFGTPVSNYAGWFGTAVCYYLLFALITRDSAPARATFRSLPLVLYSICAIGNLLAWRRPIMPAILTDAVGHAWRFSDIRNACVAVSLVIMLPLAVIAMRRLRLSR